MLEHVSSRKMRRWAAMCVGVGLLLAGCMSLPEVYVPQEIGVVGEETDDSALRHPLQLTISAKQDRVLPGDPVYFRIQIVNLSDRPLWVPVRPDVLFLWIYPDGTRDNHVRDVPREKNYSLAEVVRLAPRQVHETETRIRTDFFPRTGIVEFRAVLVVPHNTNPSITPFPAGRFSSNRYGVYVGSAHGYSSAVHGAQ